MIGNSSAYGRLATQLEAERRHAAQILPTISKNPARYLDQPLPSTWRTVGMVQTLSDAVRGVLVQSPARGLAVAQLAAAIAGALPDSYPQVLRAQAEAHAWLWVSNAHRLVSHYDAAFHSLDLAERRIADEPSLAHDRAVLTLARALTLREIDRMPEALELLEEARGVFRDYADETQVAKCELVTGMIYQRLGDIDAARQAYMRVIPSARAGGDLHTVAAAYNNLGRAAADAGHLSASVDALQQARAIFRELDMPTESTRVSWSIGAAQLAAGNLASATTIFEEVRREFLRLAMPEEAGLAGVDLIESLLATEQRVAARELVSAIIEELRRANLNERALHALAYLRETADVATPAVAHHVGVYLRRLKDEPKLLFIAPV